MEAILLHTCAPTVYLGDNTSCISVVEPKRVTPRVKHIKIAVRFLQELFDNGIFVPKYEKYCAVPEDMCAKLCSGPIISRGTKCITGLILYPTSDT